MIVIFNDKKEHELFNDLLIKGLRIDCYPPLSDALYINSYRISNEILFDYIRDFNKKFYSVRL